MTMERIESAYTLARERYASLGVDTTVALDALRRVPVSLHCCQGDDVGGFESMGEALGGGLAATGINGFIRSRSSNRQCRQRTRIGIS